MRPPKVKDSTGFSEKSSMGAPGMKGNIVKLAEKATQEDVVSAMTSQMRQVSRQGSEDLVRNVILGHITEERYDIAIDALNNYLLSKPEYPEFKERSERYIRYSIELIHAIRTKRSFPGWNALNMSKQKELFEKALMHFEDLKLTLGKVDVIEREVRIEDVRSTVWVVQAFVYCVGALLFFAVLRELTGGVIPSANVVVESTSSEVVDFIFDRFKL